ncbi:MAG: hypothetical protein WBO93_00630 [Gammaproteobacteria bacterium]|jgi:hypothetical protein
MSKENRNHRLVNTALLLSLYLYLYGCAGPQAQRGQSAPDDSDTSAAVGSHLPPKDTAQDSELPPVVTELELSYAELIRDMGTPSEQQRVQNYLAGKSNDPAIRDFLISWYLERKDFDSAGSLIARAQSDQQPVPVWQRLAIAVEDNDRDAVQRLLQESQGELPPQVEVDALQRVGLDQKALTLAQQRLRSIQTGPQAEQLATQADALAMAPAAFAEIRGAYQELGDLNISTGTASLSADSPLARIAIDISENRLDSDNNDISVDAFDTEQDISLRATRAGPSRQLALALGTNLRDDKDIVYGQFLWDERFSPRLSGRAELGINQITIATAFLRAIGTKSSVSLGASFNPNRWEFARGRFELHRYQTRDNERLGDGFLAEAALGRVVLQELPRWHIELRGSWEKNELRDKVPTALIPRVFPPSIDIETIIPPDYQTLGVATTLDYGSAGTGPLRRARVLFDGWAGWLWPANDASYNVRLGLGTSVFGRDMLSLDGYYANALSGIADQAYKGIGLAYRYYF